MKGLWRSVLWSAPPDAPDCLACPLSGTSSRAGQCLAWARGTQLQRPARAVRRQTPHHRVTAAVIRNPRGEWLIIQRLENGLLGNLWGFPGDSVAEGGDDLATSLQEAVPAARWVEIRVSEPIATIKHAYTHFRITLHTYPLRVALRRTSAARLRRCPLGQPRGSADLSLPQNGPEDRTGPTDELRVGVSSHRAPGARCKMILTISSTRKEQAIRINERVSARSRSSSNPM